MMLYEVLEGLEPVVLTVVESACAVDTGYRKSRAIMQFVAYHCIP